jgi:carboxypeptidase T
MHRPLRRARRALTPVAGGALLASMLVSLGATPTAAADPDFPAGQEAFHTYAEMAAEVQAAATAYPSIVQRFSIGKSYQGRALWAVKISDNVAIDEDEPEVLVDGLHHADEHMSLEMTLAILRWLTQGYGTSTRITNVVDSREIWIIFAMNPDGAAYDIKGGNYHNWRKNRQPTSGSTAVGTDLNRNYDYRWGCCGGASSSPSSSRYRGKAPFSAPETRAFRDFVRSRVIDGRQQIRASVSFHTTGRLVMWPYGYTLTNVPADMTKDDRAAFAAMGRTMAGSNGYTPIQASDLYISSGTSRDWLYGKYRVFAYTFEMSPDSTPYPKASAIASETGRNKSAVLYLMERAACPYRAIDKEQARCGAFDDDLEVARGWTANPLGTDTATGGSWARGNPSGTRTSGGPKQLDAVPSGSRAFVTGLAAGSSASANDLDGGTTTVQSPAIDLPDAAGQKLTFRYYLAHASNASSADELRVLIVGDGGSTTTVLLERGAANDDDAAWAAATIPLDAWAGTTIRIRLEAVDEGPGSLIEAAVDDVRVTRS